MSNRKSVLFLPELIEPVAGPWEKHEVEIAHSCVDTEHRIAMVPKPHTEAQRHARFHEAGHIKWSPSSRQPHGGWPRSFERVMQRVKGFKVDPDRDAVERLSKMVEENRIDSMIYRRWTWDGEPIDTRSAREVLDWGAMPPPTRLLDATCDVLQLAWTVWASENIFDGFPARPVQPATREYFHTIWEYVCTERRELGTAILQACRVIYERPTDEQREILAAELARFFPKVAEPERKPELRPDERVAREEAEKEEREEAEAEKADYTGMSTDAENRGHYEIHDHTRKIQRVNVRIPRRRVAVTQGVDMRNPHRYLMDKAVFSHRLQTEAGVMIDGSSSMMWTPEDMKLLIEALPAVHVGLYAGHDGRSHGIRGRICILAKQGRFSIFEGKDPSMGGGNAVDLEALQLLATWPRPRLWISDGLVCGGIHTGPPIHHIEKGYLNRQSGRIHEKAAAFMKRHEIYRVPNREVMHKLLLRQRVTLYRTTRQGPDEPQAMDSYWPDTYRPEPVTFQL